MVRDRYDNRFVAELLSGCANPHYSFHCGLEKIAFRCVKAVDDSGRLIETLSRSAVPRAAVGMPLDHNPVELLSNRELEVLEMIGRGMTVQEIAEFAPYHWAGEKCNLGKILLDVKMRHASSRRCG